jgi:hypothetical protein
MAENPKVNRPWLVAVWPGMGHVALNAGYYLLAKLDMHVIAEFEVANLFDVDHVEVKEGLIESSPPSPASNSTSRSYSRDPLV